MFDQESSENFTRQWTTALPSVSRYISSLVPNHSDRDEILQQTAIDLLQKFSTYDRSRPFVPWVITGAKFQVMTYRKKLKRSRIIFDSEFIDRYTESWEAHELSPDPGRLEALHHCVGLLPTSRRRLLELTYNSGLQSDGVAKKVGKSPGAVRVSLMRIRHDLRKCIEGFNQRHFRGEPT